MTRLLTRRGTKKNRAVLLQLGASSFSLSPKKKFLTGYGVESRYEHSSTLCCGPAYRFELMFPNVRSDDVSISIGFMTLLMTSEAKSSLVLSEWLCHELYQIDDMTGHLPQTYGFNILLHCMVIAFCFGILRVKATKNRRRFKQWLKYGFI